MTEETKVALTPQMQEMVRDLRKKLSKARPVVAQVERGELKVLDAQQERMATMFPVWTSHLGLLLQGQLPPRAEEQQQPVAVVPAAPQQRTATPPRHHEDPNASSTANGTTTPNASSAGGRSPAGKTPNNKQQQQQRGGHNGSGGGAGAVPKDMRALVQTIVAARRGELEVAMTRQAQKALIDLFVKRQVDHRKLQKLTAEYEMLCLLRRDIMSGKIAKPTKVQEARVKLIDVVKRQMVSEEDSLRADGDRVRLTVQVEVADLLGEDDVSEEEAEEVEEAAEATAAPAAEEPTPAVAEEKAEEVEEEVPQAQQEEEVAEEAAPEVVPAPVAAPAVAVPAAAPSSSDESSDEDEEPPAADDDDDGGFFGGFDAVFDEKKQKKAAKKSSKKEKAAEAPQAQPQEEAPQAAVVAAEEEEEIAAEAEPEAPPPPAGPVAIDWSDLTIIRNRPQLQQTLLTQEATADLKRRIAARSASRGRSASANQRASPTQKSSQITPVVFGAAEPPAFPPALIATATTSSSSGGASPAAKEGGRKGGNSKAASGKQSSAPAAAPAPSPLHQALLSRVRRDMELCRATPLPTVRFEPYPDDPLRWHVNVAPVEGPLAGVLVPLEMAFGEMYPQDPPVVRSRVDIPHPAIIAANGFRDVLCFEHTRTSTWSPGHGALSVLLQLQTFFAAETFEKLRIALGGAFRNRIAVAKAECARFTNAAVGHVPERPYPPLPVFNGPFEKTTLKTTPSGELVGPGTGTWLHGYGGAAHTYNCSVTIASEDPQVVFGVAAPNGATGDRVGHDEYGFGLVVADGTLRHNGRALPMASGQHAHSPPSTQGGSRHRRASAAGADTDDETLSQDQSASVTESATSAVSPTLAHASAPARKGDTLTFVIDLQTRLLHVMLNHAITLYGQVPIPAHVESLVPTVHITDRSRVCLELSTCSTAAMEAYEARIAALKQLADSAAPIAGTPVDATDANTASSANGHAAAGPLLPSAALQGKDGPSQAHAGEIVRRPIRCFMSLATPAECTMGVAVAVARDPKTFMPTTVSFKDVEYVSAAAFGTMKPRRGTVGRRSDAFIPLVLTTAHAARALAPLKAAITTLCRNPDATTAYAPPFKPRAVVPVLFKALQSVLEEMDDDRPVADIFETFVQMVHCLAALAADVPDVQADLRAAIADPKAPPAAIAAAAVFRNGPSAPAGLLEVAEAVVAAAAGQKMSAASAHERFESLPRPKRRPIARAIVFSAALRRDVAEFCANNNAHDSDATITAALCAMHGTCTDRAIAAVLAADRAANPLRWEDLAAVCC